MTHTIHVRRTAVVTGAARGIGAAVARCLTGDGSAVGVIDLDEADGADTVEALTRVGGAAPAADPQDRVPLLRGHVHKVGAGSDADVVDPYRRRTANAIAPITSFLVSPRAGFVSGQVIYVAGGPVN